MLASLYRTNFTQYDFFSCTSHTYNNQISSRLLPSVLGTLIIIIDNQTNSIQCWIPIQELVTEDDYTGIPNCAQPYMHAVSCIQLTWNTSGPSFDSLIR